jgi:hypothetical protein
MGINPIATRTGVQSSLPFSRSFRSGTCPENDYSKGKTPFASSNGKTIYTTWCHVRPHEGKTFNGGGLQLYRALSDPATLAPQEFPADVWHKMPTLCRKKQWS